jgi:hypothetical protein
MEGDSRVEDVDEVIEVSHPQSELEAEAQNPFRSFPQRDLLRRFHHIGQCQLQRHRSELVI